MSKPTDANAILAILTDHLTEDSVAEARKLCGVANLERGALTEVIKDQSFSIEDLVTLLMSGWILQAKEIQRLLMLENICNDQRRAIDEMTNQSLRLRSLLGSAMPDQETVTSFEMLNNLAVRVEQSGPSKP